MPIIDNTYFQSRELFIPNNKDINAAPIGSPTVQSELDLFIEKYEREFRLNAFGVTINEELETALLDLPAADQKWRDLVDGVNYTIDSKTYRWEGLKGFSKQSVIAFYVYSNYLRNDESTYTTVGVVKNDANNAKTYSFIDKYVIAWAEFIKQYQGGVKRYVDCHTGYHNYGYISRYFNLLGCDYSEERTVNSSLYQFLTDYNELDPSSFPDFDFKFYESYNRFGI